MNQMKKPLRAAVVVLMLAVHASAQQGPGLPGTIAQEPGPPTRVFGALGWEEPGMPSTTVPPHLAGVAFPHRRRDVDPTGHLGCGVQLSMGRCDRTVRARERCARRDRGRSALTVLLRHRVLAQGASNGARRIGRRKDWLGSG